MVEAVYVIIGSPLIESTIGNFCGFEESAWKADSSFFSIEPSIVN